LKQHPQTNWRYRIFASTWLSYAGFYFCRKPFFIAKPALAEELSWDPSLLGIIGTAYLIAYTIGQFIMGWSGTKWGPRILLLSGMALSVIVNFMFGITNSWITFTLLMVINGFAQSTGWSNNVAAMAPWFTRKERGTVMGFWATNYQIGGVLASALSAWALAKYGIQWSFWAGSIVLLGIWIFFLFNQRNKPEDVGLQAIDQIDDERPNNNKFGIGWSSEVWTNILLVGGFYFFVKFIRYALWSWTPFLLYRDYGLALDDAGYLSTAFDLAGAFGVIAAGYISDKYFSGRRAKISFYFIIGMAGSTALLYMLGPTSLIYFGISLALVGFTLYGPDALMTGAGAIEVGTLRSAALAAGIINGLGAIGSVVQELLLGSILDSSGAGTVFAILLASAIFAAFFLYLVLLRNTSGKANL
jgi:OPA family glycerol-3-phosphate transporter-like MFS transporter